MPKASIEERKEIATKALELYPKIVEQFTEKWLRQKINEMEYRQDRDINGHSLAWLLSKPRVTPQREHYWISRITTNPTKWQAAFEINSLNLEFSPEFILQELEQHLTALQDEPRFKRQISKAKNQFWETLSEIEVAGYLKKNEKLLGIEPSIDGKTPDCLANFAGREYCIELFTPGLSADLRDPFNRGKALSIKNRLREQLEVKLQQLPENRESIIIVNRAYSEQDAIHLEDAIIGSLGLAAPKKGPKIFTVERDGSGLRNHSSITKLRGVAMYKRHPIHNVGLVTESTFRRLLFHDAKDIPEDADNEVREFFESMRFNRNKPA